jgi:hypothetical protein
MTSFITYPFLMKKESLELEFFLEGIIGLKTWRAFGAWGTSISSFGDLTWPNRVWRGWQKLFVEYFHLVLLTVFVRKRNDRTSILRNCKRIRPVKTPHKEFSFISLNVCNNFDMEKSDHSKMCLTYTVRLFLQF